jgi:hypothetical protein
MPHRGFHGERVSAERLGLREFRQQGPSSLARWDFHRLILALNAFS